MVLAGGGLGNAVLFSIGQAFRRAGSKVLYFAGYKKRIDRYKIAEIEAAADAVVWCCDEAPGFAADAAAGSRVRRQYRRGDGAPTLRARWATQAVPFAACDRMIAIGSDRMMAAVGAARHSVLAPYLKPGPSRDRIDQFADAMHDEGNLRAMPAAAPRSGDRQGQLRVLLLQPGPADRSRRLRRTRRAVTQNPVQEKLTAQWIGRCLYRAS